MHLIVFSLGELIWEYWGNFECNRHLLNSAVLVQGQGHQSHLKPETFGFCLIKSKNEIHGLQRVRVREKYFITGRLKERKKWSSCATGGPQEGDISEPHC